MPKTDFEWKKETEELMIHQTFSKDEVYAMYKNVAAQRDQFKMQSDGFTKTVTNLDKQLEELQPFYDKIKNKVDAKMKAEFNENKIKK